MLNYVRRFFFFFTTYKRDSVLFTLLSVGQYTSIYFCMTLRVRIVRYENSYYYFFFLLLLLVPKQSPLLYSKNIKTSVSKLKRRRIQQTTIIRFLLYRTAAQANTNASCAHQRYLLYFIMCTTRLKRNAKDQITNNNRNIFGLGRCISGRGDGVLLRFTKQCVHTNRSSFQTLTRIESK